MCSCVFVGKGLVCIFVHFCFSLDHFGFVLLVLLGLFFSVMSQEIGWEECLRPICVEWDVKPLCAHSLILFGYSFCLCLAVNFRILFGQFCCVRITEILLDIVRIVPPVVDCFSVDFRHLY